MSERKPDQVFENFPRRDLSFTHNRRQFLRSFVTEVEVSLGRERGGEGYSLAKIGSMPDETLSQLMPDIVPDCKISVAGGSVWGQLPDDKRPRALFVMEPEALFAFNLMDGQTTLGEIGRRLALELGWPAERAFAYSRGLFLHLILARVCAPRR